MDTESGMGRREFLAGTLALGAVAAGACAGSSSATSAHKEGIMATATIDGLEINYDMRGSGPALPPDQTPDRVRDRILEFGRAHK